jgi:hypothetical protein
LTNKRWSHHMSFSFCLIIASPIDYLSPIHYIFSLSTSNNTFDVYRNQCCSKLLK